MWTDFFDIEWAKSKLNRNWKPGAYSGLPKFDNPPPPPVKKLINIKVDETTAALEKLAEKFIQMDKAVRRARLARRLEFIEIPWMGSIDLPMSKGPHMITGNIYRIIFMF